MATTTKAFKVTVDTSEATESIDKTTDSVEDLGKQADKTSKEMSGGFKAAEQGTKKLGSGIGNLIKSLGIIGIAMSVFTFMKDILSKNQKIMDALGVATTAFEILLNKVFEAVEPLGAAMSAAFENPKEAVIGLWEAIKTNILNRVKGLLLVAEAVGKTWEAAFNLDWDGFKEGYSDYVSSMVQVATGLDAVQQAALVDGVKNFTNDIVESTKAAVNQADALVELRNELTLLEAGQQKIQLTFQREAELQRQARDDIRLTLDERIKANDKLGKILDDQIKVEQARVDKALELAIKERDLLGANTERKAAVLRAEGEQAELDERIASQKSEQLTNQAGLEKELFDIQQELRSATLDAREKEFEELDIYYETLQEKARLAGESDVEIASARVRALAELQDKFRKEDATKDKAAKAKQIAEEKKLADAKVSIATSVSGVLGSLQSLINQQSKEGVIAAKTLAVAQIAIDTAVAITGAIAQAQSVPYPGNLVAIATGVAAVVAGISSAVTTLNTANVPGGGSAAMPSAPPAVTAPSFAGVTTNTTELGNTEAAELAPIQAFVVETQLTGSQNEVNQIEGQAEFGGLPE